MREINVSQITDVVEKLCIEANVHLPSDVKCAIKERAEKEPWAIAKNVLETFGKSDYYENMTEEQRFEALEQIGDVLETYSYGPAADGFVWDFYVNKQEHSVSWTVKYYNDTKVMWMMPGY